MSDELNIMENDDQVVEAEKSGNGLLIAGIAAGAAALGAAGHWAYGKIKNTIKARKEAKAAEDQEADEDSDQEIEESEEK